MLWFRQHVLRRRTTTVGRSERGATAVEYGVILTLFVAGMFGAVTLLRTSLNNGYQASEVKVGSPQSMMAAPTLPSYDPNACGGDPTKWQNPLTGACETSQKDTCAAGSQGWDSSSNTCVVCDPSTEWFNSTTVKCDASTKPSCTASSQGWDPATNQCVACSVSQPFDPDTGTCKATPANCPATQPYDSGTGSCLASPTNCPVTTPFDSGSNSCKATAANCAAQVPARWYSGSTCDVVPTCSDPAQPYDSTTNTCKATAANCAAQVPLRYLSGSQCLVATVPAAPTKPSGVRGNQQVTISWSAPSNTGGVPITDYIVEYSTSAGGPWTPFADGVSASTSATVTGLTNGVAYYFRVTPVNAVGNGTPSPVSNAVTPKKPYSGATPSASYGPYDVGSGSTHNLYTQSGIGTNVEFGTVTGCTNTGGSSSSGCSRYSFDESTGEFAFNSGGTSVRWGGRNATITVPWTIAATSDTEGASGSFTIRFT